jgi:hypothetical protein
MVFVPFPRNFWQADAGRLPKHARYAEMFCIRGFSRVWFLSGVLGKAAYIFNHFEPWERA